MEKLQYERTVNPNRLPVRVSDCEIHSHMECSPEDCEVKQGLEKVANISDGQITVTVVGAVCSLLLSTLMAGGAFVYHFTTGHPLNLDLWEQTIIMFPFGGAFVLKMVQKVPWSKDL